jgi:hypothetical protein
MSLTYVAAGRRPGAPPLAAAILFAAGLTAPLALSACLPGAAGPSAALARLNPMAVDPARLRAAVRVPDTVRIMDAELTVTAQLTGSPAPEVRNFPLTVSDDPAERVPLAGQAKAGFTLTVLRLDDEQAAALGAWRKDLIANRHGKLSLAIGTDACRLSGSARDPVPLTVYIAAAPTVGFATLTPETDLLTIARDLGQPLMLPICASG